LAHAASVRSAGRLRRRRDVGSASRHRRSRASCPSRSSICSPDCRHRGLLGQSARLVVAPYLTALRRSGRPVGPSILSGASSFSPCPSPKLRPSAKWVMAASLGRGWAPFHVHSVDRTSRPLRADQALAGRTEFWRGQPGSRHDSPRVPSATAPAAATSRTTTPCSPIKRLTTTLPDPEPYRRPRSGVSSPPRRLAGSITSTTARPDPGRSSGPARSFRDTHHPPVVICLGIAGGRARPSLDADRSCPPPVSEDRKDSADQVFDRTSRPVPSP
jgi:hypothetical protein